MSLSAPPVSLKPGKYRHYKGRDYQVFGLCRHSETEQWLVSYRCLYGDYSCWVRPVEMFVEQIVIDGTRQPRFAYIGPLDDTDLAGDMPRD